MTSEEQRAYPVVGQGEFLPPNYERVARVLSDAELRADLEQGRGDASYRVALQAEQERREGQA